MTHIVRVFLALEAILFGAAALIHSGALLRGYEHLKARTAESVIAIALALALSVTFAAPVSSRGIGLIAQGFALAGTIVGLFTIAVGVGPRTTFDLAVHSVMIGVLVYGLLIVARPATV